MRKDHSRPRPHHCGGRFQWLRCVDAQFRRYGSIRHAIRSPVTNDDRQHIRYTILFYFLSYDECTKDCWIPWLCTKNKNGYGYYCNYTVIMMYILIAAVIIYIFVLYKNRTRSRNVPVPEEDILEPDLPWETIKIQECCVCVDGSVPDAIFVPCRHQILCRECARRLDYNEGQINKLCPHCHTPINKLYLLK